MTITAAQVQKSIETGQLQLSGYGKFSHWSAVGFLLIMPVIFVINIFITAIKSASIHIFDAEIWFILIPGILSYLIYRL